MNSGLLQTLSTLYVENEQLKQSLEQELDKQNIDELTQLSNRNKLLTDLKTLEEPILLLIDIEKFKNINDIYGEEVGDLVLCEVASILQNFVNERGCKLYKISSDEFAIAKDLKFDKLNCSKNIDRLNNLICSKAIYVKKYDLSVYIDVTIGVSFSKTYTLGCADMALKKAKEEKLAYKIYDEDVDKEYKNVLKWTIIIDEAIKNDKIVPYFQPILDSDENILKYESLMRIEEKGEVFSPSFFLDIAKKSKQYNKLEKIMILKVIDKIKNDQKKVNLNVSIEDMVNEYFIEFIEKLLQESGVAKYITFEVLESESIDDYDKVMNFINMVRSYGCLIAIDDFGSGFSNFAHLLKLDPNYIKIDGSLIKDIDTNKNSLVIVQTINDFAHKLGIKTVAEYVHKEEIFHILKDIGIDEYQGYYFAKPKKCDN